MTTLQKTIYIIMVSMGLTIVAAFAMWWFTTSHLANNYTGIQRIFDVLLFALVTFVIWHPIMMSMLTWAIASHIKTRKSPVPEVGLKVAVVTTFVPSSESIELLHKTLPALVNINYPHDTWVLDEGNDPDVKNLCAQYGVNHFSRNGIEIYNAIDGKFAKKTKGGNHNSWYDTIGKSYDIVAQMDTDFIAQKDYLTKTLGYFKDPKIAFVGTPQIYGNTKDSIIARGAAQQTFAFYGPTLRGMDGMDTTLLIGANHVIRVAALRHVDFYSAHITEDLLTGMKLHSRGWKSVYVPEALAIGEGPTDWKSYFSQQKRWAYGCMHILFAHSPKLHQNMNLRRVIYYFFIQQHYFTGLAMAVSTLLLVLYFGLGIQTAQVTLIEFLAFYVPVIMVISIIDFWLQRFNVRPEEERGIFWSGMYVSIAAWPIFFAAFMQLFKSKKLVYKVTPKGSKARKTSRVSMGQFMPHITIGVISFTCAISSFFTGHNSPLMVFWALLSGVLMFLVPIVVPIVRLARKEYKKALLSRLRVRLRFRTRKV